MAVGYSHSTSVDTAMAEAWTGGSWRVTAVPVPAVTQNSDLNGVSCPAVNWCIAVGQYQGSKPGSVALAEGWNGYHWHVIATPAPKSSSSSLLQAVSCSSSSLCMAVGSQTIGSGEAGLAEKWNGSKWAIVSTVNPTPLTNLFTVSCTSSLISCMAGGLTGRRNLCTTRPSSSNGMARSSQASATPVGVLAMEATCTASVAKIRPTVAVGSWEQTTGNVNIIDRWHGHGWFTSSPVNVPKDEGELQAVSCPGVDSCWSVGYESHYRKATPVATTEAEYFNGSRWSMASVPNGPKSNNTELYGISCPTTGACMAVGQYAPPSDSAIVDTFAVSWNGQKWTRVNSPIRDRVWLNPRGSIEGVTKVAGCLWTQSGPKGSNRAFSSSQL